MFQKHPLGPIASEGLVSAVVGARHRRAVGGVGICKYFSFPTAVWRRL